MNIQYKSYGNALEIIKIKTDKNFTITVETFQFPDGYKSFAHNSFVHHYDLEGYGAHKDKKESMKIAIQNLYQLMEEHDRLI